MKEAEFYELFHALEMDWGDNLIDGLPAQPFADFGKDRKGPYLKIHTAKKLFRFNQDGSLETE